jgi:protein-S-isoprenylcysteine O-methyltransferase Ste14
MFFLVVPFVVFPGLLIWRRPAHWDAVHVAGLVLTIAGIAMITVARLQLGNSFSVTPQARKLITTGVYRRIRNPIYVFGEMTIVGLLLYAAPLKLLWLAAALIPVQVLRARAESRTLETKFGDEYRAWKQTTWF